MRQIPWVRGQSPCAPAASAEPRHTRKDRLWKDHILSNFDRFDVYDFDNQLDAPVDSINLKDLPIRWGPLAFLFPTAPARVTLN
jgi:hypothetical protein